MIPPGEITMVNLDGDVFRARVSRRNGFGGPEFLYNPAKQAFQYRVIIPNVEVSMVVVDVTERELRHHLLTGTPVLIRPKR
jgi:hypothetical protein